MQGYRRKHGQVRPRGWFSLFGRFGGWISVILGVALVVATLFSASALYLADKMDRWGRFASATVVAKRIEEVVEKDGDTARAYFLRFTFKASGGGQSAEVRVDKPFFDAASPGEERLIRYLAEDPNVIEYELGAYRARGEALRWVGLAMGLGGLLVLWRSGSRASRAVRARQFGRREMAVIVAVADAPGRKAGKLARLEWREGDGRTGASFWHGLDELRPLYQAGDRIVVFRLGKDAFWEGDVGPRAVDEGEGEGEG